MLYFATIKYPPQFKWFPVVYDDTQSRFIVRNSWGTGWGQAGYFMMPYNYFTNPNLASDFWTIRLVEAEI